MTNRSWPWVLPLVASGGSLLSEVRGLSGSAMASREVGFPALTYGLVTFMVLLGCCLFATRGRPNGSVIRAVRVLEWSLLIGVVVGFMLMALASVSFPGAYVFFVSLGGFGGTWVGDARARQVKTTDD